VQALMVQGNARPDRSRGRARQEYRCADCDPRVKFELLLNRKTEKSQRLEFPTSLLLSPKR
jgi:hypothetical protein